MNSISKKVLMVGLLCLVQGVSAMDHFFSKELHMGKDGSSFYNIMICRQEEYKARSLRECTNRIHEYKPNKTLKRSSRKSFSLSRKLAGYDKESRKYSNVIPVGDSVLSYDNSLLDTDKSSFQDPLYAKRLYLDLDEEFFNNLPLNSSQK